LINTAVSGKYYSMTTILQQEIGSMSVTEKILLVEDIWDQIAETVDSIPLTKAQIVELDRRYQAFLQNPSEGSPWSDVKKRILGL